MTTAQIDGPRQLEMKDRLRHGTGGSPTVDRTDIRFWNEAPGSVVLEVTFRNPGETGTDATVARVSSAVFGAFVPWKPLGSLAVPPLDPVAAVTLRKSVLERATDPLGPPDRITPAALLLASGASDRQPRGRLSAGSAFRLLAPNLFALLGRPGTHWAGNINVFVGRHAVERHRVQALRVHAGRPNFAMFVVGSGPDHYAFSLTLPHPDWTAELFDLSRLRSLAADPRAEAPLSSGTWITFKHQTFVGLVATPPAGATEGSLEVQVRQRSSGKTATVEFSLDPSASGPGCFTLA
jgi:hypothetical protein